MVRVVEGSLGSVVETRFLYRSFRLPVRRGLEEFPAPGTMFVVRVSYGALRDICMTFSVECPVVFDCCTHPPITHA